MVDALSQIPTCPAAAGHIKGVVCHLLPSILSHVQYADDTIILIEKNDLHPINLKFILLCFGAMSGLKVNLNKSQALVLGLTTSNFFLIEQKAVSRVAP